MTWAEDFDCDTGGLPPLDETQRRFLGMLRDTIRRLQPADLDLGRIEVGTEDGTLWFLLPHRRDDDLLVTATVSAEMAVVGFSYEHEHFWPDDPVHGRVWPVDAPDFVTAAARLVEQVFLGRIELEVRRSFVVQRTKAYWINDEGERELFTTGTTVMPSWHRMRPTLIRFDFGAQA